MQTLGRFYLLVATYSVLELYQRFLWTVLGCLVMDVVSTLRILTQASEIGCGFFLLGCFSRVFNVLGMLLIFGSCLKILHIGWHFTGLMRFLCEFGGKPIIRFCVKNGVCEVCEAKITPMDCGTLKSSQNPNLPNKKDLIVSKENVNSVGDFSPEDVLERKCDKEMEVNHEDEISDVMTLKKLVKIERRRAKAAYAEVEKERTAAASAADEAMAMILRLQSEKSSVEIQAKQYRRMAEQKQEYDQEVIESLRWIIMKHEDQLRLYMQKLRQFITDDEIEQFQEHHSGWGSMDFSVEDDLDASLISSLEMESETLFSREEQGSI